MEWFRTLWKKISGGNRPYCVVGVDVVKREGDFVAHMRCARTLQNPNRIVASVFLEENSYKWQSTTGKGCIAVTKIKLIEVTSAIDTAHQVAFIEEHPEFPRKNGIVFQVESDELLRRLLNFFQHYDSWSSRIVMKQPASGI